jgi:serine/threonine protein kinase/tetratricopeptide (TPR) repeat protein
MESSMIGQTISHYKILEKLGEGGMGVVYKAEDTRLKRIVALKFLTPHLIGDEKERTRFVHEARSAAGLDHPNVCTIHEIDTVEDHTFIAMAYVPGDGLESRIERGPLRLDEAVRLTLDLCEALEESHSKNVVHRDIKPANVIVSEKGRAVVLDFGLAMLKGRTRITREGTTVGTVNYMSPEQARGDAVDHRTDIWSVGVVLYQMITGRLPFKGDHETAVVYSIMNEEPEPVTALRTGVSMELERLIDRCLEKEPGARYQTAGDLASDLGRIQGRLVSSLQSTITTPRKVRPRRRSSLAVVGGVLAAVLVLGAFLFSLNVGNLRDRLLGEETESPIRSLAVLPFSNMMGDAEQDFFVEGMHEALITELSKIGTLSVISRTSAMYYRETDKSIPEIARELDVDALVEGSVLRVGDRVRITAQLIRGANDEHLWAEDYDRDLRDILNLLSEVARSIAGEINIALTPLQQERLTNERTVDPDVYEMYLRGLYHIHQFTEKDALESRRYFQQVVEADSTLAEGYAGLSASYIVYSIVGNLPPRDLFPPAQEAAQRALELDPGLSSAHTVLGFVEMFFNWNWAAAEGEFHRALEQNPNDGDALHGMASILVIHGRLDEAVELVKRGRKFDPYSYLRNMPVWIHLMIARRYQEAITEVEQWRAFSGDTRGGWSFLYRAYYHQGRNEEAMVELRHSSMGRDPELKLALEKAYTESGIRGAFLVRAERFAALSQHEYIDPLTIATTFALARDTDRTFVWLEKTYEERVPAIHLLARPALDPYRSDPRFRDLMVRMGIPESSWERLGSRGD